MPYLGSAPATSFLSMSSQSFTGGSGTSFTLNKAVSTTSDIAVFVNNVRQSPVNSSYSVSGTTLTMSGSIASSDNFYVVFLGSAVGTINPASGSVGISQLSATGTKDATTFLRGDNSFAEAGGGIFETQLLHVVDEKSNNTAPQSGTGGQQNVRELNTVKTNEITGASLGSNQITLPSGTFYAEAEANAYNVNRHKLSLYNTTDSSYTLIGSSANSNTSSYTTSPTFVSGRFTIGSQKVYELRHYIQQNTGMGASTNTGLVEVYASIRIWKVS